MFFLYVFKMGKVGVMAEIVNWKVVEHPLKILFLFLMHSTAWMVNIWIGMYTLSLMPLLMKCIFSWLVIFILKMSLFCIFALVVSLVIFQVWHTRLILCVYIFYILTYWELKKSLKHLCALLLLSGTATGTQF